MKSLPIFFSLLTLLVGARLAAQEEGSIPGGATGMIAKNDTVSVKVFREPDLDSSGRLAADGTLTIPLIGSVKLAGLSTAAAEKAIEAKFKDGYLVKPEVEVRITARPVETVKVSGQVKAQGLYVIPQGQGLTLVQAISLAGGVTEIAKTNKITIVSGIDGKKREYNLKAIMKGEQKDVPLSKNDLINVPESFF